MLTPEIEQLEMEYGQRVEEFDALKQALLQTFRLMKSAERRMYSAEKKGAAKCVSLIL